MAARWVKLFGATPLGWWILLQDKSRICHRKEGLDAINPGQPMYRKKFATEIMENWQREAGEGSRRGIEQLCGMHQSKRNHFSVRQSLRRCYLPLAIHSQMLRKELAIHGVWNSSRAPFPVNEWTYTVQMLDEGKFQVKDLITGRYSLDELPGVIDEIHNGKHHEVKTMCTCMPKE